MESNGSFFIKKEVAMKGQKENILEKVFKLKANNTNVKTELLA